MQSSQNDILTLSAQTNKLKKIWSYRCFNELKHVSPSFNPSNNINVKNNLFF